MARFIYDLEDPERDYVVWRKVTRREYLENEIGRGITDISEYTDEDVTECRIDEVRVYVDGEFADESYSYADVMGLENKEEVIESMLIEKGYTVGKSTEIELSNVMSDVEMKVFKLF